MKQIMFECILFALVGERTLINHSVTHLMSHIWTALSQIYSVCVNGSNNQSINQLAFCGVTLM